MPPSPFRPPRLSLTGRIARYALSGLFGLFCLLIGGSWFVAGKGAIMAGFPGSLAEATASTAGGLAVTLWAAYRLRRECRAPADAREPDESPKEGA